MSTLKPIDEFGSRAWGEAVVECSIKMLEATSLPTSITWALTEDYTHPPARLMADSRMHSGYYLMVKDGKVSGGDGVVEEALRTPGFHCRMPWTVICNQAAALYGTEDQRKCTADEMVLYAAMAEYVGRPEINKDLGLLIDKKGKLSAMLHPVGNWQDYEAAYCPPVVMQEALEHLQQGYGGVPDYVRHIGVTNDQVKRLRRQLLE
jgi:hypothetical protein